MSYQIPIGARYKDDGSIELMMRDGTEDEFVRIIEIMIDAARLLGGGRMAKPA